LVNDYYISNDSQHQHNERVHATQGSNSITNMVVNGGKVKKKKKFVQFVAIFHLLKHGKPITNFEHMKGMFDFLNVHHTPRKHWTYSSGWEMATALHNVVLKQIKSLV
jgi:hypothetical protein